MPHADPEARKEYKRRWQAEHRDQANAAVRRWKAKARSHYSRTGELPSGHGRTGYEIGCKCRVCREAGAVRGGQRRDRRTTPATTAEEST